MTELIRILSNGVNALGVSLSDAKLSQFLQYTHLLLSWNQKMNLTAITDTNEIATKHYLDSLSGLSFIGKDASVIDVGTGAGFPGIPLKIARPDISLTLLDSLNKRLNFLNTVAEDLSLSDVTTVHARAEDGGNEPNLREAFDVAVSRAVSRLNVLLEYCLPYVKVGGVFLAYKGGNVDDELHEAKHAIEILGGALKEVKTYTIPETDITHSIVVIQKQKPTPDMYPRQQGKIKKQPLL